jgi:uncharacterized membrane protein
MRNFVAVIVASERAAFAVRDALARLDAEGAITVHEAAVIERLADGTVVPRYSRSSDPILRGSGVGALLGALVGLSAGPIGVVIGGAVGILGGALDDAARCGATDEYIARIAADMTPAAFALIADVHEVDQRFIDSRMTELGASVLREARKAPVEELLDKRDEARRAGRAAISK